MSLRAPALAAALLAVAIPSLFAQEEDRPPDRDGDGVADVDDACPATPRGATAGTPRGAVAVAARGVTAGVRGCSALEIAQEPHLFLRRAVKAIDEARATLGREDMLAPVARGLDEGRARFQAAADRIRAGDVCGGLSEYDGGLAMLDRAGTDMDQVLAVMTPVVQREGAGRTDHSGDDHVTIDALEIRRVLIGQAAAAARDADLLRAPCAAASEERVVRGAVMRTLDASRRVELADGRVFGLPAGPHAIHEGMDLQARALEFPDGTGILLDGPDARVRPGGIDVAKVSCVDLRIAPVQPFEPSAVGPYTLHHPDAYFVDPRYRLEEGMRLATVRRYHNGQPTCGAGTGGRARTFKQYSLRLELQYNGSATWVTLASDLVDGETPVALPPDLVPGAAILQATEVRSLCHPQPGGLASCEAEDWSSRTYDLSVLPRYGHARVVYDREVFDLEDDDTEGWRPTHLDHIQPFTTAVIGMNLVFKARGCRVASGVSSCDNGQVQEIVGQDTFAIYNTDFFEPEGLFTDLATGVEGRVGLMWPRVVGSRNGHEFWYSARPPTLVRDAVDFCPVGEDSFYRLPFFPGFPVWSLSNGNWPGHCQNGAISIQQCPQRYAFDFPDSTQADDYDPASAAGLKVRAARGGVVTHVKESAYANQWACYQMNPPPPGGCDNGNRVHIRHDDGSYGAYWHFKGGRISVDVGDTVHRGDIIGTAGSTGNSSTPHLHFHVQPKPTAEDPGLSIRVRFQTANATCEIPQVGDSLFSNNDPALWD